MVKFDIQLLIEFHSYVPGKMDLNDPHKLFTVGIALLITAAAVQHLIAAKFDPSTRNRIKLIKCNLVKIYPKYTVFAISL